MSSIDRPRAVPRYIASPPLQARFGEQQVSLLNLSVAGAMLLHPEPLAIGGEAPVRMEVSGNEALALYAEIVWSRPHRATGQYLSGVRFTEWIEVAQHAIDELLESKAIHLDSSAPPMRVD